MSRGTCPVLHKFFWLQIGDGERDSETVQGGQGHALVPSSPAQDSLWLRFELLEATENYIEDELVCGGYIPYGV